MIQRPKFILIEVVASRSCVMEEQELILIFDSINLFLFVWGYFLKHSKIVSYFVFLIRFLGILSLIKIILIKIQFLHSIPLNVTILLCLQITNLD